MSGLIANWVKETTTTSGTGTITLAGAVPGFIAFTDYFTDGVTVKYCIQDGNDREIGLGVFTASGTTLTRATIIETLVAGTFDNTSPSAINLSGISLVFSDLTANNLPVRFVKESDTPRDTDVTPSDDPDLSGWNLDPGSVYRIYGMIIWGSTSATPGFDCNFQISQTPVVSGIKYVMDSANNSISNASEDIEDVTTFTMSISTEPQYITIEAYIDTHASLASVLDFQWSQSSSNAISTILKRGSYLEITKLIS